MTKPAPTVTFWGAARTVTGSMHFVEANGQRFLLDCGLFQGKRAEARERNSTFPFDPGTIDTVVLSQAHIQEEDARYFNKKRGRGEAPIEPLYRLEDVRRTTGLCIGVPYHRWFDL